MHCPVSKIWWTAEHEHGSEKVAGHFTSVSFDTLSQWHLKAINAILELCHDVGDEQKKECRRNVQKHWLLFSWFCVKGGDETASFAVSQACTRTQMNQNQRHIQIFNVFWATAYALSPEALVIAHREHRSVSRALLFFLCCFTYVHTWFP